MSALNHKLELYILSIFLFLPFNIDAQNVKIKGFVIDKKSQSPLEFATISIKNGQQGTVSDQNGFFSIEVTTIQKMDTLIIAYLGYKLYKISLENPEQLPQKFALSLAPNILSEVLVTPLTARQRFLKAVEKIKDFFSNTPFITEGYYREIILENNKAAVLREAVLKVYQNKHLDSIQDLQIQVLEGHKTNNADEINFMKKKTKKSKQKAIKKAKRKGKKEATNLNERIDSIQKSHPTLEFMSQLGGPSPVFESDPIRFLQKFKPKDKKGKEKYDYQIINYTYYQDRNTSIFELTSKKDKTFKVRVYISDNDEIMLIEAQLPLKIPRLVKAALYVLGYGIKNLVGEYKVYYRPVNQHWVLAYEKAYIKATIIDRNLFKANESYRYGLEVKFVATDIKNKNVKPISINKRIDPKKDFGEQLGKYNSSFWKNYRRLP